MSRASRRAQRSIPGFNNSRHSKKAVTPIPNEPNGTVPAESEQGVTGDAAALQSPGRSDDVGKDPQPNVRAELEPAPSKLAEFADLIQQIEINCGASNDLDDLRRPFIAAVGEFSFSRYRLGRELCSYRCALPHGAYGPLIEATARFLTISERTLREIVASYEKVKDTPPLLIQEFEDRGIDPGATKRLALVRGRLRESATA